jgi:hypothetical protein
MSAMRIRLGALAAVLVLAPMLAACEEKSCEEAARDEYYDQQKEIAKDNGDVPSISGMWKEADRYAISKCS